MSGDTSNSTTLPSNTTTLTTTSAVVTIITSTVTTLTSTISQNASENENYCSKNPASLTCRLADFVRVLALLLLAISLLPQIVHLFNHGSRYIAGISYMWIIIRVLALASLMIAHAFEWSSILEFIALISTIAMFIQIFIYADNLHRQQKVVLITTSLAIWMIGGGIILLARKNKDFLMITGYLLLSVHMLPQVRKKSRLF
jgi:hypothetical protein